MVAYDLGKQVRGVRSRVAKNGFNGVGAGVLQDGAAAKGGMGCSIDKGIYSNVGSHLLHISNQK